MTTTPANDNAPRPASYDAQLVAHTGFLRMIASKFVDHRDREELVQDTCIYALRRWSLYNPEFKFSTWLSMLMKNVLRDRRMAAAAMKRQGRQVEIEKVTVPVPPEQERGLELAEAISAFPSGREGHVLHQRLLGHDQKDIAAEMGVSSSRVQQLEARGVQLVRRAMLMRQMTARLTARRAA